MTRYTGFFSLMAFFSLLTGCCSNYGNDSVYSAAINEGRAAINEVMEETGAASISVALVDGERMIWSEAFGTADREAGRSATTDKLYGACSISKIIATVAVMILVDQGDVSLDESVTTYIPNFSMPLDERYRDITVRMLLNHSSGMPGYEPEAVTSAPFPEYAARMLDGLAFQRLLYEPGSISAYNNDGFTMVENLVKAVTGEDYPNFVRQRILEPLGMNSSQFQDVPLPEGSYARAYDGENLWPLYSFNVYASGGLYSTPEELSRVAMMLINEGAYGASRIISARAVAAMAQDQRLGSFNPVPCDESRYGLGWDTVAQPGLGTVGVTAWQKAGDISGIYGSNMVVLPDEKLGVVVFGASGSVATMFGSSHAMKISNRILLRVLVERGRLSEMPDPLSTAPLLLQAVTQEEKDTYPGIYASSFGICRLNYEEDDSLTLHVFDGTDWTPAYANLKLRSDGWYAADSDPITALRLLSQSKRSYIALRQKGASDHYSYSALVGQRLDDDKPPISSAWKARLNETWLPVNKDLSVGFPVKNEAPGFRLKTISGLTGYLLGNKILSDMTPPSNYRLDGKFLIVPDNVRGMEDAAIEIRDDQEWLRLGSYLYRPLSEVPLLAEGPNTIFIGNEGFAEWLHLPPSGALSISGATHWLLYDADIMEIDSGTVSCAVTLSGTDAKYLVLYGESETDITLSISKP